jgi:hypothetical protein
MAANCRAQVQLPGRSPRRAHRIVSSRKKVNMQSRDLFSGMVPAISPGTDAV